MIIDGNFQNYWKHKGHIFGQCFYNLNLCYINIPKNASTFVKDELYSTLGWSFGNYYNLSDIEEYIVVLRDPVDRWMSGIAQYYGLYHSHKRFLSKLEKELISDLVVLDDHTEKQILFLNQVNTDKCVFFKFDSSLSINLYNYFNSKNISNSFHIKQHSALSEVNIKNQASQMLSDTALKEKIINFYKDDYDLINNVSFYNVYK